MKILIDVSYIQTTPFFCLCENKALLQQTNVLTPWQEKVQIQAKILYFLIVRLWTYICCYFMINLDCIILL